MDIGDSEKEAGFQQLSLHITELVIQAREVLRQDENLDALYAAEIKRIFSKAAEAMFYNFHTGVGLLFILRAIERIGDHAKQLATPSF